MIGCDRQIVVAQYQRALGSQQDFIQRLAKTTLVDAIQITPRRQQRGFIHQVRQVRAYHTRR